MCDCVYCQGDKPWSGDPDEWPHTPPVYVFLALQDKDPNLWWRMPSGHGQNIAEDAIDVCEELINENKLIKSILTDLLAELRNAHPISESGYCLPCTHWGAVNPWNPDESNNDDDRCPSLQTVDRAEQRLREVQGE